MILGFLPRRATAERIAARSTSSGTPVKSCNTMRATTKGISAVRVSVGFQLASSRTFVAWTFLPSQLRRTDSSTRRMETGSRETGPTPDFSSCGKRIKPALPAVSEIEFPECVKQVRCVAHITSFPPDRPARRRETLDIARRIVKHGEHPDPGQRPWGESRWVMAPAPEGKP